eukprot:COSAG03_NODE_21603_length_302_cov_0.753695_1_plen_25_part_01
MTAVRLDNCLEHASSDIHSGIVESE